MSTVLHIALAVLVAIGVFELALRLHKRDLLAAVVGVGGLLIALIIPQQIDERAREVQKLGNCVTSVLEFRHDLLDYYRLKEDDYGNILDPNVVDDNPSDLRIRLQNSKDSTYTLCSGVGDGHNPVLDSAASPWKDAPISANDPWMKNNVADLYAWSTRALAFATGIQPERLRIPGTPFYFPPHIDW